MQGTLLQQQRPLAARRHHAGVAPRSALRMAPIRASSEVYVPPSSRPASTELSSLERYSEVVPDVSCAAIVGQGPRWGRQVPG